MKRYNPTEIEPKWQAKWEEEGTYKVNLADQSKPKYYAFSMLPGITGAGIHIGHGRTYQFSDIKVRAKRQQGYNAYHPIGWDSFGLPVENYAIKVGKKPREAHDEAKVNFKRQLKRLGFSYDWSKEVSTADPEYYKWTQWIFNQLYKHNLAYQKESPQWWCETDQTVLANEQVEGGKCWRCHNPVTKRNLRQWFFRITAYADEILEATDELNWTESVKVMQKNWIGRSLGAELQFRLADKDDAITVFSTRPDTVFGATFVVLAPEHTLAKKLTTKDTKKAVEAYIAEAARKSEIERMNETREKTGVFTGSYALNPATGEQVPIWIADYVLAGYGTGAIMAVPAHDDRDFAFAEKFHLPIRDVVAQDFGKELPDPKQVEGVVVIGYDPAIKKFMGLKNKAKNGRLGWLVGGGREDGETFEQAAYRELREEAGFADVEAMIPLGAPIYSYYYNSIKDSNRRSLGYSFLAIVDSTKYVDQEQESHEDFEVYWGNFGEVYRLTGETGGGVDHWLEALTRARQAAKAYDKAESYQAEIYVGEGILVNSGAFDGMRTEQAREEVVAWLEQQGLGQSKITYKMRDWLISRQRYWGAPIPIVHCEKDGAVAVPDDQLPVILPDVEDYKPKGGATSVLAGVSEWVHTTCPTCGGPAKRETDTMDGYACSSWYFLRYLDPFNDKKAWDPKLEAYWGPVDYYNGADHAVAHLLYARFWMRFFYKLGLVSHPEPFKRMMYNAYILAPDGHKMSKSLGNVIDPLEIMDSGYGADSLRVYEMFIAPYEMEAPWDTRGVPGTYRFLNRVWNLAQEYLEADEITVEEKTAAGILTTAHRTIKKVTEDIENDKFNTAISTMMEAVNTYFKLKETAKIGKSNAWTFAIESLLKVLAPFAPHITEELWYQLGHKSTIHIDTWPEWDDAFLQTDEMTIVIQVNGKVRAKLSVEKNTSEEAIKQQALAAERITKVTGNKTPTKIIYIPGRVVNIVL